MLCIQAVPSPFRYIQALHLEKHCIKYAIDYVVGRHLIIFVDQLVSQCVFTGFFLPNNSV